MTPILTRTLRHAVLASIIGMGGAMLTTGCAPQVPPGTQLIASGHTAAASMPDDGMVYITDKQTGESLYTGRVKKGDLIVVDAEKHQITLNGAPLEQHTLRLDHDFEVRFGK